MATRKGARVTTVPYAEFVAAKTAAASAWGHQVEPGEIHPLLKPHQRDIVQWAVRGGRRGIFAAFGLGKSFMQIECARIISHATGGRFLIVAPLGVRQEFYRDVETLATGNHPQITDSQRAELCTWQEGHPSRVPSIRFVRSIEECGVTGIYITNYETVRDGK